MGRKPRAHSPRAVYHVVLRGNYRQTIFADESGRQVLSNLLADGVRRSDRHRAPAHVSDAAVYREYKNLADLRPAELGHQPVEYKLFRHEEQCEIVFKDINSGEVELESANTIRNLPELVPSRTVLETFKMELNALTVKNKIDTEIKDSIKLRNTRPFVIKDQPNVLPKRRVFNKVVGDSHLERRFAAFLEDAEDVASFAKNYFGRLSP